MADSTSKGKEAKFSAKEVSQMIIKRKTTTTTVEEVSVNISSDEFSIKSSAETEKEIETAKDLLESVDNLNLNSKQERL